MQELSFEAGHGGDFEKNFSRKMEKVVDKEKKL